MPEVALRAGLAAYLAVDRVRGRDTPPLVEGKDAAFWHSEALRYAERLEAEAAAYSLERARLDVAQELYMGVKLWNTVPTATLRVPEGIEFAPMSSDLRALLDAVIAQRDGISQITEGKP